MGKDDAPSLLEMFKSWIYKRFGLKGLFMLALLCFVGYLIYHWDDVATMPGIKQAVGYLIRERIPKADPNKFSVIITHLDNDPNHEQEQLVIDSLTELKGIQVLTADREIKLTGSNPEQKEKNGKAAANQILTESGASIVIWGSIVRHGSKSIPKLYITSTSDDVRNDSKRYIPRDDTLCMPEIFWSDMGDVFRLLIVTRYLELSMREGTYIADQLIPFINKVKNILDAKPTALAGWDEEQKNNISKILADALHVCGQQSGDVKCYLEAILIYKKILQSSNIKKSSSMVKSMIMNCLASTLIDVGDQINDPKKINESIEISTEVINLIDADNAPFAWSMAHNNIGVAYALLADHNSGTKNLEIAIKSFNTALVKEIRERMPMQWASIQNNLGGALTRLGDRTSSKQYVLDSIQAYYCALEEWTHTRAPIRWAKVEINLGCSYSILGELEGNLEQFQKANMLFVAASKEIGPDHDPHDWARCQSNLINTMISLSKMKGDKALLLQAINVSQEALGIFQFHDSPLIWAAIQNNLGNALSAYAEYFNDKHYLNQAAIAYRDAMKGWTRERAPMEWATAQNNLGMVLISLAEKESDAKRFAEGVSAFREALRERTYETAPFEWAASMNNLGNALARASEFETGTLHLEQSIKIYRAVLKVRTRDITPLKWADSQTDLANSLLVFGARTENFEKIDEAISIYRETLKERNMDRGALEWAKAEANLAGALALSGENKPDLNQLKEAKELYILALGPFKQVGADLYVDNVMRDLARVKEKIRELETNLGTHSAQTKKAE